MNSIVCSDCFKKYSLRVLAESTGVTSDVPCPRCNSSNGKHLSEEDFLWLMTSYFENGSIDLGVGNHQPKYRLRETDEKPFESLALDTDLIQDCEMLHQLTGYSVDLNYSRLTNMGIWGVYGDIKDITSQVPSDESFDKLDDILKFIISKFEFVTILPETKIFRIKKNLTKDIDINTANVFDPYCSSEVKTQKYYSYDRFSTSTLPIFYGAFDISTCLFECRTEYHEELTLGTFEVTRELKLLDLENFKEDVCGHEREDVGSFISRMLYRREYALSNFLSVMAFKLGYQGIRYCSYFSKIRRGRFMNIAIFGKPITSGALKPVSFDRVTMDNIEIEYSLGPVFQKEKEKQIISEITSRHQQEQRGELPNEEAMEMSINQCDDDFQINIHSLATIKNIYR